MVGNKLSEATLTSTGRVIVHPARAGRPVLRPTNRSIDPGCLGVETTILDTCHAGRPGDAKRWHEQEAGADQCAEVESRPAHDTDRCAARRFRHTCIAGCGCRPGWGQGGPNRLGQAGCPSSIEDSRKAMIRRKLTQAHKSLADCRATLPERTLHWVATSVGSGCRVVSVHRLALGGWHANHAVTVVDGGGVSHRLVLRRWARPGWTQDDPDFNAAREVAVLRLLKRCRIPAPRMVAADPAATLCDVPAILTTRILGHPPTQVTDMDSFLGQLAEALVRIHDVITG